MNLGCGKQRHSKSTAQASTKEAGAAESRGPADRNTAGGLRSVGEHSTLSALERSNWRGQCPGSRVRIGMRVIDSSWIHRWLVMMVAGT
jgi:hypothetical protein